MSRASSFLIRLNENVRLNVVTLYHLAIHSFPCQEDATHNVQVEYRPIYRLLRPDQRPIHQWRCGGTSGTRVVSKTCPWRDARTINLINNPRRTTIPFHISILAPNPSHQPCPPLTTLGWQPSMCRCPFNVTINDRLQPRWWSSCVAASLYQSCVSLGSGF